ncbi:hypothetical protein [Paraburkholderia youngii]|uniref:hypothetical protein n=1 Tax=Paraburkholderia youngii TaxID=2782701 RepID=UPI003D1B92F3
MSTNVLNTQHRVVSMLGEFAISRPPTVIGNPSVNLRAGSHFIFPALEFATIIKCREALPRGPFTHIVPRREKYFR